MVFTDYEKRRMLELSREGPTIACILRAGGSSACRRGISKFLVRYARTGSVARQAGSGRSSIKTQEIQEIVETKMWEDDESTVTQLHQLLIARGYNLSLRTMLRCRTALGWTFQGSAYCQLIRTANKALRLQ